MFGIPPAASATTADGQFQMIMQLTRSTASNFGQLSDALVMERDERIWLKNQVEKLSELVIMERDRRLELQNQVEQQGVSILDLKNVVHEMKSKIELLTLTSQKQKKGVDW